MMTAVFVALMFVSLIIVDLFVEKWRAARVRGSARVPLAESPNFVATACGLDALCQVPEGIHLSPDHTWLKPYTGGGVELGVDALLAHAVGAVGRIVLPKVGAQLEAGQPLFRVEHNGHGMTIPSAVTGRVLAVNNNLHDHPELLGQSPYGEGWVCYLAPAKVEEQAPSPSFSEKPVTWLECEFARLREFIITQASPNLAVGITGLDGGVPSAGCLSHLDQKAWTAFEAEFLRRG